MLRLIVSVLFLFAAVFVPAERLAGQQLRLIERRPDPHGSPRPFRDAEHVPLRTSIYLELESADKAVPLDPAAVSVELFQAGERKARLLEAERKFVAPATGWIRTRQGRAGAALKSVDQVILYIEPNFELEPEARYEVRVQAKSDGDKKSDPLRWSFTIEAADGVTPVAARLDLSSDPVHWRGRFFSGLCNVVFCTPDEQFGPTYALMDEARQRHPRAWSNQRDFWMTGFEYRKPGLLPQRLPNIVRERETRRIIAIEPHEQGTVLKVEDFFGHEQYGIESNRPLSEDYHVGNEILVADGLSDARAKVVSVDDEAKEVVVTKLAEPKGGWKLEYEGPLPTEENPDAPGLFPPGGCYLRKFAPHGTAVYYWGRLDKEWDLLHRKHGRRLFVNFADAPGDLAIDGRSWTTVKDYAQWHAVAQEIAGHVIDRYGDESLTFTWSIFNEPDLGPFFWRASWEDLQRYYDYTTDAILRAFEDRGYDSSQVFIGGLELGGIFGTNLRLKEFLAHCSPTAEAKGALPVNAAFADKRLDGKRSRRVEALCRAHQGKGSPCDFVSIHAYNNSAVMAAKLVRAKEMALEIDPEFYANLWVNSHEACPEWNPPPDEAAADSYLGNGYFPTWCLDVASRQLDQAARDSRYAFGETLLTVWPPPADLAGMNAITRILHCDDDGDGEADRSVTVANPVFHALNLLSDMGDDYWPLPRQDVSGHIVSGFASRDKEGVVRIALFAHQADDTQSRSAAEFEVELAITGAKFKAGDRLQLTEHRFDTEHNSYFAEAVKLRQKQAAEEPAGRVGDAILKRLSSGKSQDRLDALAELEKLSAASQRAAVATVARMAENDQDQAVRDAAQKFIVRLIFARATSQPGLPRAEVERIEQLSRLQETGSSVVEVAQEGQLKLQAHVSGNGVNMLTLRPAEAGK